ncbi:MAG TPA: TIGR03668 family PPOX class F420-dependent oxidoreductase [Acidimicrobiia bacterium]|jgi:PPOX class probable F420-dependent enzyme|nr:TIGR03668 family PPOX class F420-dependent oxidoreductase [Acidimicrobiia bacterium]
MDDRDMRGHVVAARVARLATLTPNRQPSVVPICFTLHNDAIFSVVDFKPKTTIDLARLENVRANPNVSLVVDRYDDEMWNRLWWVRIDGPARVIENGVEHTTAIQMLRSKYPQYAQNRPTGAVIAIECKRWTGWSAGDASNLRQPVRRE